MNNATLSEYVEFARETAYQAGQLTLQYYQKELHPDTKSDGSPVTIADRQAEQLIRAAIEKRYPGHAILGEEYGSSQDQAAEFRWIIDPIDGTKSFVHGVPLYSVLIGLEIAGKVEVGVVYFPALNEMVSAATGSGCWWNGRQAHVSPVNQLDKSVLSFTDFGAFYKYGGEEAFMRLAQRVAIRAGWTDAYGYALAATGRVEIMMDPIMAVWDCGPFPPIFAEAGGYFGDWQGNLTIQAGRGLATSQALLPEVLRVIELSGE
ncbi:MAG TPA: inositol monophosphatase family protein [Anaerolineaceae bacterium]